MKSIPVKEFIWAIKRRGISCYVCSESERFIERFMIPVSKRDLIKSLNASQCEDVWGLISDNWVALFL